MNASSQSVSGLIVSGTASDVGKSSIAIGLMRLFKRKGLQVQPFKVGPDYIDPSHHVRACGRPSYNLDSWMSSRKYIRNLFHERMQGSDVAVVEGVMGLYDGAHPKQDRGSTAEIAKILGLPVLLVIDGRAMARSAAALVNGFLQFDKELQVLGVIANRVDHPGHSRILKNAIEHYTSTRYLGHCPSDPELKIPSRHLGLFLSHEQNGLLYDRWADHIERYVDTGRILREIKKSKASPTPVKSHRSKCWAGKAAEPVYQVAVAKDASFQFIYQDTLDLFEHFGVRVEFFSPLKDRRLPSHTDWIYFPGGYPELHLKRLASNCNLLSEIRDFAKSAKPIVAECGGMMYLGKAIIDEKGKPHKMAGLFNFSTTMQKKKLTLGYRKFRYEPASGLGKTINLKGHEFHFSGFSENRETPLLKHKTRKNDPDVLDGFRYKNCFALYSHIHWASSPEWLKFILRQVKR